MKSIRGFFDKQGFVEVDTPTLVRSPDPSQYHEVFEATSLTGEKLYLIPSPEYYLKRLISEGMRNIYQITKCYRDSKEKDPLHRREFTMLEWYRDNADYTDLMADCEKLFEYLFCNVILKTPSEESNARSFASLRMTKIPWPRISCEEAFAKYANVKLDNFTDISHASNICNQKGYNTKSATWEQLYHQIFLNEVEPELVKIPGVFLYDYPAQLAELSKTKKDNPKYAERFEWYLNGLEIGNGYSELTDWQEQEKRLQEEVNAREMRGMKTFDYDHGLVAALRKGLPKTAGIAVGIDRLTMALTGEKDIVNVSPYNL